MLTHNELVPIIGGDAFMANLHETALITSQHEIEAGFAVYRLGGGFAVSSLVDSRDEQDSESYDSALEAMENAYAAVYLGDLMYDDDAPFEYDVPGGNQLTVRSDILAMIHSHPNILPGAKASSPADSLRPSKADLEIFEQLDIHSPGLVGGIVVVESDLAASMLLFRRKDRDAPNVYTRFPDKNPATPRILESMRASGFGLVEVRYNLDLRSYEGDIESQLAPLF
jgi:hypothetical protein